MRKKHVLNTLYILTFCCFLSCEQAQIAVTGTPALKIGSSVLYQEDLEKKVPESYSEEQKKQLIEQLKENWIKQELLVQEAFRLGISNNRDIILQINQAKQEVLAQALREHWLINADSLSVSKSEAQQFYEKNKSQFVLQERHVRFRHIITADLENSKRAKTALLTGVPFEQVVERYALEKNNTLSSATVFYPMTAAASTYPELNRYLEIIGVNEISPIRLLEGNYHFVQLVEERNKGEHPDLDWIMTRIKDWLLLEKKRKILTSLERELYLRAEVSNEITIYPTN